MVWFLDRIHCTGTLEDYRAVLALLDKMSTASFLAYRKAYKPAAGEVYDAFDSKEYVRDQVDAMDCAAYFKLLADLMKTNPPAVGDAPMVAKLATIGLVPGRKLPVGRLDD
jgi:hypothetical protein